MMSEESNSEKSVSFQKKDGPILDNDKDPKVCFLMTHVYWACTHKCQGTKGSFECKLVGTSVPWCHMPMMTSHIVMWPGCQTCTVMSQFPTRGHLHENLHTSSAATCDSPRNLQSCTNCSDWCSVYMRNPWVFEWRSHISCDPCKVKVNTSCGHPVWVRLNETWLGLKWKWAVLS